MTFDPQAGPPKRFPPAPPTPVEPSLAALLTIQAQVEKQTDLLHAIQQELIALRETQQTYQATMASLDRQMRWARWVRRMRGAIALLFWLGVAAVIAYYWAEISQLWEDIARFIL
ncbi:MAG: hypothetical protein KF832_10430 [Caldilineaceae bacterium]|nr:hypothetical protein [Caldilineaceae bacterium]